MSRTGAAVSIKEYVASVVFAAPASLAFPRRADEPVDCEKYGPAAAATKIPAAVAARIIAAFFPRSVLMRFSRARSRRYLMYRAPPPPVFGSPGVRVLVRVPVELPPVGEDVGEPEVFMPVVVFVPPALVALLLVLLL